MTDLGEIINIGKLENVLSSMHQRLDAQDMIIHHLRQELANKTDSNTNDEYKAHVESITESFNKRINVLEQRMISLDILEKRANDTSLVLDDIRSTQQEKLNITDYEMKQNKYNHIYEEKLHKLTSEKASKGVVQAVEDSQHRLVEHVMAFQKMLACKVDRVEIPLLHAANDKMQTLMDFQKQTEPRINRLEEQLVNTEKVLQEKESKIAMVQRMQAINEILKEKTDQKWLETNVVQVLKQVRNDVNDNNTDTDAVRKINKQHSYLMKNLEKYSHDMKRLESQTKEILTSYNMMESMAEDKPSKEMTAMMIAEELKTYQNWVEEIHEANSKEQRVSIAHVTDLRNKFTDMKRHQNGMDKKLEVALRFIDWFANYKDNQ